MLSTSGILLPLYISKEFATLQAFLNDASVGVILSVAWVHLLGDSQECLSPLTTYPAANCAMIAGFLAMVFLEAFGSQAATCVLSERRCCREAVMARSNQTALLPGVCALCGHARRSTPSEASRFKRMEAGISFHSIVIGLGVGASATIGPEKPLALGLALCPHQFLEGYALGALGKAAQLDRATWLRAVAIFAFSLPLGMAIAVGAASAAGAAAAQAESGDPYNWATGLMNGFCAGMLTQSATEVLVGGGGGHSHHASPQQPRARAQAPSLLRSASDSAALKQLGEPLVNDYEPPQVPQKVLRMCAVSIGALVMSVMAAYI
jgi:zinc transporter ZupT